MRRRKETESQLRSRIVREKNEKIAFVGKIKKRYPEIKELKFEFSPGDKPTNQTRGPEDSAFFEFDCPYWECVNGGYDLSALIEEMIKDRKTEYSDKIYCQGWQDWERVGKFQCMRELEYKILITYK